MLQIPLVVGKDFLMSRFQTNQPSRRYGSQEAIAGKSCGRSGLNKGPKEEKISDEPRRDSYDINRLNLPLNRMIKSLSQ